MAEENLVNVSHVKHVHNPAKIGATAIPPSVLLVDDEVMLHVNSFLLSKFFKLYTIEKRFVYPIGNSTPEGSCVIVFLDFP